MRQIWIARPGGPEVLEVREAADPAPGPGEVAIDVHACGVNFADVVARMGMYPDAPKPPCVVGYEVAGIVTAVGAGDVSADGRPFRAGDRVVAFTRFGGYSSLVCVSADQVYAIPDDMSLNEAAAIPVNYVTASLAVERFGNLQPGERILIHNAGGGVGIAAIQLAKEIGATIYGTSSAWKHDQLKRLGADELIDYRTEDWVEQIRRRTDGVDVILDPIGGRNLARDLSVLAPLGRVVSYGLSEPVAGSRRAPIRTIASVLRMPRPGFLTLLNRNWAIAGLNLAHLWSEKERMRVVGNSVFASWQRGAVQPVIAAEVPFSEAAEAHKLLEERKNLGKVLLIP
jgi:synaptic vesicle membrane protein VAT-1